MPELHWLGDDNAKREARRVPYRLLEPVETVGDASTGNLLIQGDNLEALKALLPFYAGRVKCIFIDPPYNTKSAFEHYDDNLEHSQWLSMMYPRLELLRDLLAEDGSIWVTIDDNEAHYLKVLMDEVFGRKNFVANVVWRAADSSNNDSKQFSLDHNHVFIYSKVPNWLSKPLARTEASDAHYKNSDNDPRGSWFAGNLSSPKPRENLRYALVSPTGVEILPPANGWRWSKETMQDMIGSSEVIFTNSGTRVLKKTYLADQKGLSPSTVWDEIEETGHNRQAKYELKKLFPTVATSDLFATPKPERLVQRALEICTEKKDLILDSFLGSGTTAAVAQKMNRRYIGIEMGDHAATHCLPRLKKVVDGEQGGISESVGWKGGGGFRFMKLGESVFLDDGRINPAVRFATLASYLWFLETGAPHATNVFDTPLLGVMRDTDAETAREESGNQLRTAIILLYNGILGDRRPQAGNVLTSAIWNGILAQLPPHDGPRIIYGEACRLSPQRLKKLNVTFKQIPYDIRMR